MLVEAQAGAAHGGDDALDHVAAGRDEQHALARAVGGLDALHRLPVQDRLVQRHRDDVLRLEAHRGVELLAVLDDRKIDRTHGELLVGHADANAPVQAAVVAVQALSAAISASTSWISPSRTMPGSSDTEAARSMAMRPPEMLTWVAWMPTGSMSRPTSGFFRCAM